MKRILLLLSVILLSGCLADRTAAPKVDTAAMQARMDVLNQRAMEAEAKIVAQNAAQKVLDTANLERLGKLKVNVTAAHGAVDTDNKPVAQGELTVAEARLADVQPDPQEQIAAEQRKRLVAEGKMEEAQAAYGMAAKDAQDKAAQIGTLTTQRDRAVADADKARQEAAQARLEAKQATDNVAAQIADALKQEQDRLALAARKAQIKAANWGGGICGFLALGCIAGAIFLSAAAPKFIRGAVAAGVACFLCFAFARFCASPWFDTAAKITGGIIGVALVAWLAYEIRAAIIAKANKKTAGEASMVADTIISALDTYYDTQASTEAKADMDSKLWPALEAKGPAYDAAVKRIKAAQCDEKALAK